MDQEPRSLADEAKAAIAPIPAVGTNRSGGAIGAARVQTARSRFLPYVVVGGALSCGYLNVVVAGKDNLASVLGAGITAGIVAGMAVGWVLLGLYRRRVERSAAGPRRIDLAIVLLTVPAYAVAGWASAWVGWIVAMAQSRPSPEPGPPNAWALQIAAALAIYPLSYVFARRDLDRPETFPEALRAATGEIHETPGSSMVLGGFLIGLAWFVGVLFALFGVAIGVQLAFPDYFEGAAPALWLAIAFLVAWLGLTVGGTLWTLRWIDRRRSRRPS